MALIGFERVNLSIFLQNILVYVLTIGAVIVLDEPAPLDIAVVSVVSIVFSLIMALISVRRSFLGVSFLTNNDSIEKNEITKNNFSFWIVQVCMTFMQWGVIALAGVVLDGVDVGIISVAIRTSLVLNLVTISVNQLYSKRFANLYFHDDISQLRILIKQAVIVSVTFSAPALLGIYFLAVFIMTSFGEEFSSSGNVLRLLLIGQLSTHSWPFENFLRSGHNLKSETHSLKHSFVDFSSHAFLFCRRIRLCASCLYSYYYPTSSRFLVSEALFFL